MPTTHITLGAYWMGRDKVYVDDFTETVFSNGAETLRRCNALLNAFYEECPTVTPRVCNSGWRPRAVNQRVAGSANKSKHITAQAIDLSDDDGALGRWVLTANGKMWLASIGLWAEHPNKTPRWCHLQTVAPGSGARIFFP